VFIKLTDANGRQISGESKDIHYKDWIYTTAINPGGNNNTQLSFTMAVTGASAELKRTMANSMILLNGEVNVTAGNQGQGSPAILYKIKMEKIKVLSCTETTGSDNAMHTSVTLQASRIGWIYYTTSNTGVQTESKKYGWNKERFLNDVK
jgi:type VI protein secretion system component Hcp